MLLERLRIVLPASWLALAACGGPDEGRIEILLSDRGQGYALTVEAPPGTPPETLERVARHLALAPARALARGEEEEEERALDPHPPPSRAFRCASPGGDLRVEVASMGPSTFGPSGGEAPGPRAVLPVVLPAAGVRLDCVPLPSGGATDPDGDPARP